MKSMKIKVAVTVVLASVAIGLTLAGLWQVGVVFVGAASLTHMALCD